MAKKLTFLLLLVILMAAGAVISMADDDTASLRDLAVENTGNQLSVPVSDNADEPGYIEGYSHQTVIDKYRTLFIDKENQTDGVYLKDIQVLKDEESSNIQNYTLWATLLDGAQLDDGDSIVVMAFVETEDTYELLGTPKQIFARFMSPYKFKLPFVGKENPNNIRVVAFPKSAFNSLELGVNLEITDRVVVIETESFNLKSSLRNSFDTIKQVENILQ